jgi:negative regulator of flagellin synthesis FlgM
MAQGRHSGRENPMKIGSTPDPSPLTDTIPRTARPAAVPGVGAHGDQVALSAAGTQMNSLAGGDFDAAKVEAIRQAIRDGRFTVNAGAIADRLIADATALLRPRNA